MFEEITTEKFHNLEKEKVTQVHEAQRVPIKMNPKRPTCRHITIKMTKFKDKDRILKAAREKQLPYFAMCNAHFFAQILERKIMMDINMVVLILLSI